VDHVAGAPADGETGSVHEMRIDHARSVRLRMWIR